MMLGLSLPAFTLLHVIISLAAIAAGVVVMIGLLTRLRLPGWTAFFLATSIATSVTGFLFPPKAFGPAHYVGILALVILALCLIALYGKHLAGAWRPVYTITAVITLYLNVFVAVTQAFQKLAPLNALAPTQTEPPFALAQGLTLAIFIAIGWLSTRRFRPERAPRLA